MRAVRIAFTSLSSLLLLAAGLQGQETQETAVAGAYPFLLAGALLADGESEAALGAYAEAVRLAPSDPFVHLEYASLLARAGRFIEAAKEVRAARQFAPAEPEVLRLQARIALNLADRDPAARQEAQEALERLIVSEPDDLETLVGLGQIYLGANEGAKAAAVLGRAAELRPGQPMIEALRARALALVGDVASAESVQRSLLAAHPDRLETRFEIAELLSGRGDHFGAAALLAAAPEDQGRLPEVRRRRAVELYLDGDLAAARELARGLHDELPENTTVLVLLATIEQADGRWAKVWDLVGGIAEQNPLHEQLSYLSVRALERLGRVEEALAALERRAAALRGVGRVGEALLVDASRALLAARNDRKSTAIEIAGAILGLGPDPELALDLRLLRADLEFERAGFEPARLALGEGDEPEIVAKRYELAVRAQAEAEAARDRATLAGGSVEQLAALVGAEERLERFEAMLPLLDALLAAEPNAADLRFRKATALERAGRLDESMALFETLLAAQPDHAPALNYLGYMRIERGVDVEAGLALVRRALEIDGNNGAYVDSLGWGLYRLGKFAEATEVLERASRLLPNDSTVLEHLGDACLALGAFERARDAYRRALALGPESQSALAAKLASLPGAS